MIERVRRGAPPPPPPRVHPPPRARPPPAPAVPPPLPQEASSESRRTGQGLRTAEWSSIANPGCVCGRLTLAARATHIGSRIRVLDGDRPAGLDPGLAVRLAATTVPFPRESGGTGRRTGFRYPRAQALQGSSPCSRTISSTVLPRGVSRGMPCGATDRRARSRQPSSRPCDLRPPDGCRLVDAEPAGGAAARVPPAILCQM